MQLRCEVPHLFVTPITSPPDSWGEVVSGRQAEEHHFQTQLLESSFLVSVLLSPTLVREAKASLSLAPLSQHISSALSLFTGLIQPRWPLPDSNSLHLHVLWVAPEPCIQQESKVRKPCVCTCPEPRRRLVNLCL